MEYKALQNIASVQRILYCILDSFICTNLLANSWNNAGEQYYMHKNFHMQSLKPAGGRRQNRDFKARAYMYQSPYYSSTLWYWGKDTRFLIHLSYCTGSCKKEMKVLEKPESVMMPRLCNNKMDKSAIPEREKKKMEKLMDQTLWRSVRYLKWEIKL